MYNLRDIPKLAHFYWGGGPLSWFRYLTFKSFRKHNPTWKIILHMPTTPVSGITWATKENESRYQGVDYLSKLEKLNVEVRKIEMSQLGINNNYPEVIKSDIYRWYLLNKFGGWYFDTDIFFIKPISFYTSSISDATELLVCQHLGEENYFSIGMLAVCPGSQYFEDAFKYAKTHVNLNEYQSVGRFALEALALTVSKIKEKYGLQTENIPMSVIYALDHTQVTKIFGPKEYAQVKERIGIHWYAGCPLAGRKELLTKEAFLASTPGPLSNYIKEIENE